MTNDIKPRCPVTAGLATRMTEAAFEMACKRYLTPQRSPTGTGFKVTTPVPLACQQCQGRHTPPELQIMEAIMTAPKKTKDRSTEALENELALVKAALDKSERMRDEAFKELVSVLKNHGLPVGDAIDPSKIVELTERALAGLNQRLDDACVILGIPADERNVDAMLAALRDQIMGLNRRLDELRREVLRTKRILGIDDPDGMLLDEEGHIMGDVMDAWAEVKRVLLVNQYPIPDSLPKACRLLVELVEEQDRRISGALGNLALHTSATAIEDAAMEVRDKLEAAEDRLEALENERLQALADAPVNEGEAMHILLALMRKVVTGQVSITHHV